MKGTLKLALCMAVTGLILVMPYSPSALADGLPTGKATLTGSIYCITADGTMHGKEEVCSEDHIAHVIITDDKQVYILGGSTEVLKQIRGASLKAGTRVKVGGEVFPELKAIDVRWWEEYETVGD